MAGIKNTPFTPDADLVAQLTGTGNATPGYNGPSTIGAGVTPVYAATIELSPFLQKSRFVLISTTSAVGNSTLTTAFVPPAGSQLNIQIANDASGARTITFSTGFRSTGVVTGTNSKIIVVQFVSDGTTWNESGRSASAIT